MSRNIIFVLMYRRHKLLDSVNTSLSIVWNNFNLSDMIFAEIRSCLLNKIGVNVKMLM
jgi:hypothetical protein